MKHLYTPSIALSCGNWGRWLLALAVSFFCAGADSALAQIRTDGSLGHAAQTLNGPNYLIPETLGKFSGNNLFQSFQTFNVRSGESAIFSTVTPGIANVISRVTGGELSQINGRIQLSSVGASPDFYLINPAGVVFGAGAMIDVPGSFFVSTANSVKFPEGHFNADLSQASTFSSAAPEAFGFLGTSLGSGVGTGSISLNGSQLSVRSGRQLVLAGGSLLIDGQGEGSLSAPSGKIGLFSVAGEGALSLNETATGLNLPTRFGNIQIEGGESISANGTGGKIVIQAANVRLGDALLLAQNVGPQGGIDIRATGDLNLDGTFLQSATNSAARSGSIKIDAARVTASNASEIDTSTYGSGDGGKIVLQVGELNLLGGSRIYNEVATRTSIGHGGDTSIHASGNVLITGESVSGRWSGILNNSFGGGGAGNLELEAGHLTLSQGTLQAATTGTAPAGTIHLKAGDIKLDTQAFISVGSSGTGNAGLISVDAAHLSLTQDAEISAQTTAGGRGGTIQIQTGRLDLSDGGSISNRPYYYQRSAGDITVNATESIRIQGRAEGFTSSPGSDEVSTGILSFTGNISVSTPELTLLDSGGISSRTWNDLNAGNVMVNVDRLVLRNGGHLGTDAMGSSLYYGGAGNITVNARESILISGLATDGFRDRPASLVSGTRSSGGAGRITLNTPFLRVAESGSINASTGVFGQGGAGGISIQANAVELLSGGALLSSSSGYGGGGDITVQTDRLLLDQGAISAFGMRSGIAGRIRLQTRDLVLIGGLINTESGGASKAGDIQIDTLNLSLSESSRIKSDSSGSGDAGQLQLQVAGTLNVINSTITTEAAAGNGGAIAIQSGVVSLDHSQITTSVSGIKGNGGDITINADALVMNTGFIQANTVAHNASGGKVGIDVQMLVPSGNTLWVGGQNPLSFAPGVFGLNVIQAAAPTGVSGTIQMTSPVLDLSGSLSGLNAQVIESGGLGRSPCQNTEGSSLAQSGRGGLPASARGLLRADAASPPFLPGSLEGVRSGDLRLGLFDEVCR